MTCCTFCIRKKFVGLEFCLHFGWLRSKVTFRFDGSFDFSLHAYPLFWALFLFGPVTNVLRAWPVFYFLGLARILDPHVLALMTRFPLKVETQNVTSARVTRVRQPQAPEIQKKEMNIYCFFSQVRLSKRKK